MPEAFKGGQHQGEGKIPVEKLPDSKAILVDNPFQKEIDRVVNGETALGRYAKPLIEKLSALPADRLKLHNDRQDENLEVFRMIYDYFKENPIDLNEMGRDDALFLSTTRVGSIIRRPAVNKFFAKKLDDTLPEEDAADRQLKSAYLRRYEAQSWSRFVSEAWNPGLREKVMSAYPAEGIYVDDEAVQKEWESAIKMDPKKALNIVNRSAQLATDLEEKMIEPIEKTWFPLRDTMIAEASEKGSRNLFLTDPGHAFGLTSGVFQDSIIVGMELGDKMEMPNLVKPASFMLVEDNPAHREWTNVLDKVGGMSFYAPVDLDKGLGTGNGEHGNYKTAERALASIDAHVAKGDKPPDVILSDIELGAGMNGIEFVKTIKAKYPDVTVLMLWTSNPNLYREDVSSLERAGTINASFNKLKFDPVEVVTRINQGLSPKV
ncbi:hypothetical protein ACFLRF_04010 [Candidatus Altiarchaeota archaeon]